MRELNGTSGAAGVGSAIIGGIGVITLSGPAATAIGGIGAVITILAIGTAAKRAIPPKLKRQDECVGKRLTLADLDAIHPSIVKIAVVGPSETGKSTLINRIIPQLPHRLLTQETHAYVAALHTNPVQYVAILDAPGQMYAQQFPIAALADGICVVLDHNASHTAVACCPKRLAEHQDFQVQIRGHLENQGRGRVKFVHILMNKHDLWKGTPDEPALLHFLQDQETQWRSGNWARQTSSQIHSNHSADDVSTFLLRISAFIS